MVQNLRHVEVRLIIMKNYTAGKRYVKCGWYFSHGGYKTLCSHAGWYVLVVRFQLTISRQGSCNSNIKSKLLLYVYSVVMIVASGGMSSDAINCLDSALFPAQRKASMLTEWLFYVIENIGNELQWYWIAVHWFRTANIIGVKVSSAKYCMRFVQASIF